jgi:hypothetical protein
MTPEQEKIRQKLQLMVRYPEFKQIRDCVPVEVNQTKVEFVSGLLKRDYFPLIATLRKHAASEIFGQRTPTEIKEDEDCFNCSMRIDDRLYPLGYVQFNKEPGKKPQIYISEVYVDKPARNTDVSDFLIKSATYHIFRQYLSDIHLNVRLEKEWVMDFFAKNGFVKTSDSNKAGVRNFKWDITKAQSSHYIDKISFDEHIDRLFEAYQQQRQMEKQRMQPSE